MSDEAKWCGCVKRVTYAAGMTLPPIGDVSFGTRCLGREADSRIVVAEVSCPDCGGTGRVETLATVAEWLASSRPGTSTERAKRAEGATLRVDHAAVRAGLERASFRLRTGVVDPTASKPGDVLKAAPAPSVENVYDATHGAVALGHVRRQLGVGANEPFARVAQAIVERDEAIATLTRERDEARRELDAARHETRDPFASLLASALAETKRDDSLIAHHKALCAAVAIFAVTSLAWELAAREARQKRPQAQREASRLLAERMAPGEGLVTDDMVDE
jgi:hypothetical protein